MFTSSQYARIRRSGKAFWRLVNSLWIARQNKNDPIEHPCLEPTELLTWVGLPLSLKQTVPSFRYAKRTSLSMEGKC